MKIDKSVREATRSISLGVLALSVLMQLIYLLVVLIVPSLKWHYSFLLGNLLMGVAVTLNFFFMALGIQSAASASDPQYAKKKIQSSQALRSVLILLILVLAFVFRNVFHVVSTVVTIAFPQISVYLYHFIIKRRKSDVIEGQAEDAAEAIPETCDTTKTNDEEVDQPNE